MVGARADVIQATCVSLNLMNGLSELSGCTLSSDLINFDVAVHHTALNQQVHVGKQMDVLYHSHLVQRQHVFRLGECSREIEEKLFFFVFL